MIKAILFDMFETLVTHYNCKLYFGNQMARDANMDEIQFHKYWDLTDEDRTLGKKSLEEVLTYIFKENGCYSDEVLNTIVAKRVNTKKKVFDTIDLEILQLLDELKRNGIKLGLISNCFSEEVNVIRTSKLAPYFDSIMLSYEQGIMKPNKEIYTRALDSLGVDAKDVLYVGDGGSEELLGARACGIKALQAGWFLKRSGFLSDRRQGEFSLLNNPMDLLNYLED